MNAVLHRDAVEPLAQAPGLSVLYLGPASGTSLHRRDAFLRLGHRVHLLDPRSLLPRSAWIDRIEWHVSPALLGALVQRRLASALDGRAFDIAFVDSGSLLTPAALRQLRRRCRRIVNFNHDDPFGQRDWTRFSAYRAAVPEYDLVVVVRPENVGEANALGARQVLFHPRVADEVAHAARPLTPAIRAKWASEVAFVGSWMPERGPFMCAMRDAGVPLTLFGPGWRKAPEWPRLQPHHRAEYLDGDAYAYAVQCAKVSLGMLSKGNRDLHTTRSMEIPALGGLLCAERTDEHLALYRDGEEAVFWSDSAECARVCKALLADEPRRARIAAAGHRRHLHNGHTSENLIRHVIGALP
jgi:spore maturation protein CgeB